MNAMTPTPNRDPDADSVYQRLMDSGYTPEQIQAIMELGGLNSEEGALQNQKKFADRLRITPGAEGRVAGNLYVAANPLEHLGVVMQRNRGEQMNENIGSREKQIWDEQMRRRMEYLKQSANREPTHAYSGVPGAGPKPMQMDPVDPQRYLT